EGDSLAVQRLWEVYYPKLVELARRRLEGRARLVDDEEDLALSAFKSFCLGVRRGRFPKLDDRHDLWRLLVRITIHKVMPMVRDEGRPKRSRAQKSDRGPPANEEISEFDEIIGREPTPELAAEVAEQYEALLRELPSPQLVELAVLKMEGYS